MKKTKPKKEYGFYCDLCKKKICKYSLDFRKSGGIDFEDYDRKEHDVCHDCAELIMEELMDLHGL